MTKYNLLIISLITLLLFCNCNKKDSIQIESDFVSVGVFDGNYWPTENWKSCAPEEVGINSEKLIELDDEVLRLRESNYNIHNILIIKDGYIVAEKYYSEDYGRDSLHRIHSITKSITSSLIGIAIKQNLIPDENAFLTDYFQHYIVENQDEKKAKITIENLLTMSAGYDWNELNFAYSDERNTFRQWSSSEDKVKFVLDRQVTSIPGQIFKYNTGISHILSALIKETSGVPTDSFAIKNLFLPIGIKNFYWPNDNNGVNYGGNAMRLTSRDLARFGYLYLNEGKWDATEIVPKEWVTKSTQKQIVANKLLSGYGYQWWIRNNRSYSGIGFAGQWLTIFPQYNLVVVFNNQFEEGNGEQWNTPERLLNEYILPSIL